ncbi:uncharacterized protein C8A04DRAFT_15668, partial [Dichotomopilus funicola]
MGARRLDNFVGDDSSYIGYLWEKLIGIPLIQCIPQFENLVKQCRRRHQVLDLPRLQLVTQPTPPSCDLNIWNPAKKPSTPRLSPPIWVERTNTFKNLPQSEIQWREKRDSLGLSSARGIFHAVDFLTTGRLGGNRCFAGHATKLDLQDALEAFANTVGLGTVSGKLHHQLSRFLSLILIATLCVAIHEGHPIDLVDTAQRKFLSASRGSVCKTPPDLLARDRAAVRWLLAEQQRQFARGLRHRAFELFLLEGGVLSFYQYCPKERKESRVFTEKIPLCDVPEDEIQASVPFWIPFFVKFHVGDRWSCSTICKALGVELLSQNHDFQRFAQMVKSEMPVA